MVANFDRFSFGGDLLLNDVVASHLYLILLIICFPAPLGRLRLDSVSLIRHGHDLFSNLVEGGLMAETSSRYELLRD